MVVTRLLHGTEQEREGDLELTADALLQADCLEDLASTPIGPLFDAAVADPEHSEGHSSVRVGIPPQLVWIS